MWLEQTSCMHSKGTEIYLDLRAHATDSCSSGQKRHSAIRPFGPFTLFDRRLIMTTTLAGAGMTALTALRE